MKLQYFRGDQPNFGDELNPWMWPRLLPDFFDNDPTVLLIGIGSIIGEPYEATAKKVVVGAGYVPSYHYKVPNVHSADWDVLFVRGPRTARLLGVSESLGIGDAAVLLRALDLPFRREPRYIGFMPHWESLRRGNWQKVCALADIRLINPCAPVEQVITEILACKVLVSEAMHGAIVADALRVPWIPVLPIKDVHRDKWQDWADTIDLELKPHRLWPSSPAEVQVATVYRPFLSRLAGGSAQRPVSWLAEPFITYIAAKRLSALAKKDPWLSDDGVTENIVDRMLEKVQQLKRRYKKAG